MYLCISEYKKQLLFDLINTMDSIFLVLLILVLIFFVSTVVMFILLFKKTESKSSSSEELSRILDKIHSSFNESIKTLTHEAKDKLGSVRKATNEDLENKKKLIDEKMEGVAKTLEKVKTTLEKYDSDSKERIAKLSTNITNVSTQTKELAETTNKVNKTLNSSQARGQWGEKMAEDVLRIAGFIEGINYKKQETSNTQFGDERIRPDYTFNMPDDLCLNMDVKFPLDNYAKYVSAEPGNEQDDYKKRFMQDVDGHIKTLSKKAYNDQASGTMDYVLMFIPNESVYEFIFSNGDGVIDVALQKKIIVCSPLTMFAILSVIRHSMDNFALSKTSGEILKVLDGFANQWGKFKDHMDRTEKQLETVSNSFNTLKTTRKRQLEKSMSKVKELREARGEAFPESVKMTNEE